MRRSCEMRFFVVSFRALAFISILSLPIVAPFLIYRRPYFAAAAVGAILIGCALDHLYSFAWMRSILESRTVTRFGLHLQVYRRTEGAFFLSAHPFRKGVQIWIRDSVYDQLSDEDLKALFRKFIEQPNRGQLLLETYLMRWIHRSIRLLPTRTREWISGRAPNKRLELSFPLWTVFFLGVVSLWKIFVSGRPTLRTAGDPDSRILRGLSGGFEADAHGSPWSKRIEALSILSVFPLYPAALLDYGRPCLWPREELERTG